MKSSTAEILPFPLPVSIPIHLPLIGTAFGGGYYAGRIIIGGTLYALIVAPKTEGELADTAWIDDDYQQAVPGARSWNDGLANTDAMAAAGSKLALWARDLRIDGYADWYLPSQDELEILYRNLKPTTEANSQWGRSGINLSAIKPTRPYTLTEPVQTMAGAFRQDGEQAFEEAWYWSSTQHADTSDGAWYQDFGYGGQYHYLQSHDACARAVRRLRIYRVVYYLEEPS